MSFEEKYPCLSELRCPPAAENKRNEDYFGRLAEILKGRPCAPDVFRKIENDLRRLDQISWKRLKKKCRSYRFSRNSLRGWHQLTAIFNEAKGYAFLQNLGCTEVELLAEGMKNRSCDLKGSLPGQLVFLEVKTIGPTSKELECQQEREKCRKEGKAVPPYSIEDYSLGSSREGKIRDAIIDAEAQLQKSKSSQQDRLIVFLVIDLFFQFVSGFDEALGDYCRKILPIGLEAFISRPAGIIPVLTIEN